MTEINESEVRQRKKSDKLKSSQDIDKSSTPSANEKSPKLTDRSPKLTAKNSGSEASSSTSPTSSVHDFQEVDLTQATYCQHCNNFIWGLRKQGLRCAHANCGFTIHKECREKLPTDIHCPFVAEGTTEEKTSKAFANEVKGDNSSFGVFAPQNNKEALLMSGAVEAKLLADLQRDHAKTPKIFDLTDIVPTLTESASVVVQDEFTACFESAPRKSWNWNIYLLPIWLIGIFLRYCILFPIRLTTVLLGTLVTFIILPITYLIKSKDLRRRLQLKLMQFYCSVWVAGFTGVVRYHGPRPQKRPNQVFVANHTTVFDIVILQQNFCFSVVGQKHPGIMGFFQDYVLDCLDCLWFDRQDAKDRTIVAELIKKHVADNSKLPILLFPEGVCVNNDYCIMFKKGAFELGATIHPIAIKYNKLFCDPFYNSRKQTFVTHVFRLLTNWACVCDVWYLEPQTQRPGETTIEFTNRVKKMISDRAGLINTEWDGYLKYFKPSDKFVEERRKLFASSLSQRFSSMDLVSMEKSNNNNNKEKDSKKKVEEEETSKQKSGKK